MRSGTPLFSLTLSTPDGQPGGRGLVARHVVVREGGVPVPGRSRVGATPVRYDLNGARRVQVSYELERRPGPQRLGTGACAGDR